jgi:microcystin-dependent protein
MAFIIPNAGDTLSGPYGILDQAEPDSLDFEILGNSAHTGVLEGGVVTASGSGGVDVTSGIAVHRGVPYPFASTQFSLTPNPTDPRFDLVVVDVSVLDLSGNATVTHSVGVGDPLNPQFPRSKSITASGTFDPDKHVPLAAVYRSGSITDVQIVDKRNLIRSTIMDQGSSAPLSTYASSRTSSGSLYYRRGVPDGAASGVYVKTSGSGWIELAQNVGPHVPIGGMIAWPSQNAVPTGFIEANGQSLNRFSFPALFSVLGYTWGGSGDNFNAPNLNNRYLRGTTTPGVVGSTVGSDTVTLSINQIPSHAHGMSHTHTVTHSHNIAHGHAAGNTDSHAGHAHGHGFSAADGGSHNHVVGTNNATHNHSVSVSGNTNSESNHTHSLGPTPGETPVVKGRFVWANAYIQTEGAVYNIPPALPGGGIAIAGTTNTTTSDAGEHSHNVSASGNTSSTGSHSHGAAINSTNNHGHTISGSITSGGSHSHATNIGSSNVGALANVSPATDSLSTEVTAFTGGTDSLSLLPASSHVRWIIRASYGTSTAAIGGNSLLDEALEEVVTVELVGSGSLPATQAGVAYYRMPWAATLTGVKANLNSNATSEITIDVNEGVNSVLSTKLTIDSGESSSKTAASPAVISDPTIADDALLTFDIDAADTGDSGPLTVTLYFTREP